MMTNDLTDLRRACESIVNAAHVFAAHWEGNLSEPSNYLAETAEYQRSIIATFSADRDPMTRDYLAHATALIEAAAGIEADWERNLTTAATKLASAAAAYETRFGPVSFYDPLR
jgi:hypothetical protein